MSRLRGAAIGAMRLAGRAAALARPSRRSLVLCYHSIHPTLPYASASPELFDRHLDWLAATCEVVDFADLYRVDAGSYQEAAARPRVAITFDDGYADNLQHAAPLLARHGLRATFFLTAGFLERDPAVLARFRFLRGGAACEPLDWSQARALRAAGHAIGAHTWSHPVLAGLDPAGERRELGDAKALIEDRLGEAVTLLAYPFGKPRRHFDAATADAARAHGYRMAAAVAFRAASADDDRFAVPRFFVAFDPLPRLAAKVRGDYDPLGWWHERAPRWLARATSPRDFGWSRPCA